MLRGVDRALLGAVAGKAGGSVCVAHGDLPAGRDLGLRTRGSRGKSGAVGHSPGPCLRGSSYLPGQLPQRSGGGMAWGEPHGGELLSRWGRLEGTRSEGPATGDLGTRSPLPRHVRGVDFGSEMAERQCEQNFK